MNPKTGMLYFSTSNASPWIGADARRRKPLHRLDRRPRRRNRRIQMALPAGPPRPLGLRRPSPTVLFKGEMNGEEVEAVGEPEKTGWVYLLDQKTGKPIYPIPEVKVPQDPSQKTWPTQPEPTMEPFSPIEADAGSGRKRPKKRSPAASRNRKSSAAKIFTPMSTDPNVINLVAELGGRRRQLAAVLLRPGREHLLRLLAGGRARAGRPGRGTEVQRRRNVRSAPTAVVASGFNVEGFLTAYDMSTGKINWQNEFPRILLLGCGDHRRRPGVRRPEQRRTLVAYDIETGKELWSFQTGAGANTTVTVVRRRRRRENRDLRRRQLAGGDLPRRKLLGLLAERDDGRAERHWKTKPKAPSTPARNTPKKKAKPAPKKPKAKKPKAAKAAKPLPAPERGSRQRSLRRTVLGLPRRHRPRRQRRSRPDHDAESQRTGRRRRTGDQRRRRDAGVQQAR